MHEILTLQLGHPANYLATHFWNTQESYFDYGASEEPLTIDHDIHFRAGQGPKGEDTYTPRTLIYDLKGGFGGLRKWGGLYDQGDIDPASQDLWDGSVVKQQDKPISQSAYQKALDDLEQPPKLSSQAVRYWSDFSRVFYHPRSIIQINDYELGSSILPFEKWVCGEQLFSELDKDHDILDRDIRPWAEECDQVQAIQVFASADDAWGGFASRYVESLRDEYGKTPLWFWGLEEQAGQGQRAKQSIRTVNIAQSLQAISTLASMYIPLAVPKYAPAYVGLDLSSQWHVSGLVSMAVESITLPSRQKAGSMGRGLLGDLEVALNSNGNQRIAELQCSVVDPLTQHLERTPEASQAAKDKRTAGSPLQQLAYEDEMEPGQSRLDMSFSSGQTTRTGLSLRQWERRNHVFGKVESIRGVPWEGHGLNDEGEANRRKRRRLGSLPTVERYYNALAYPLLDSFPEILVGGGSSSKAAAIYASLSTTGQMSKWTKGLQNMVSRMVDVVEREALSNGLGEMAEAYEEGWDSGGDDDSSD
ncbi:mtDNA inheritance, partitioning of the mitochondrial organelle [Xanthoria parietina]